MTTDRLTVFLYLLTRDELSSGVIERLLVMVEEKDHFDFSCPHIAALAAEWADRLRSKITIDEARSWPGDSSHENGNYTCKCSICAYWFTGHKRRVVCRVCDEQD